MADEEPKIAPAVSFRPDHGPRDEVIGDQKYGFVEQEVARERGSAPALLPPRSEKAAPQTSLAERLRHRLEQRRPSCTCVIATATRGRWLAVGYHHPGCADGGNWGKKGWWRLEPGQAATVLETTNTHSTFYAEADDGRFWAGPYTTNLPLQAFDWCWNTASSSGDDVGMRLVTATNAGWSWTATINLS